MLPPSKAAWSGTRSQVIGRASGPGGVEVVVDGGVVVVVVPVVLVVGRMVVVVCSVVVTTGGVGASVIQRIAHATPPMTTSVARAAVTAIAQLQMPYLLFGEGFFATERTTAASLDSITRKDLAAIHAGPLHPGNLGAAGSGKFDREAMVDLLNRTIGAIKAGPAARPSPKVPAPGFARTPGLYVIDKDAPQAMLQWAFPGLRRSDPDWYPAMVMNHVLGGGGFAARLMKKIRSDEGLTYGVRTTLGEGAYWRGDLTGGLQTKNTTVAYALRLALAEMQRLKDEPLSPAELASIKDGLVESFPARWGNRQAIANAFAEEQITGWPEDWWVDYRERVRAVTAAEVRKMAKKLLAPEKMIALAVGRASEIEAGDPDHPGALKDAAPLPLSRVPLRDPLTLKPAP